MKPTLAQLIRNRDDAERALGNERTKYEARRPAYPEGYKPAYIDRAEQWLRICQAQLDRAQAESEKPE